MKNGYYLSTYLYINKIAYLTEYQRRHDQSLALFKKEDSKIKILRYWELERVTGLKQHKIAFFDIKHAKLIINQLLAEFNLTIDDMEEVWGTPEIDTCSNYHRIDEYDELCYHSICHLFSALLMNTNIFYNHDIISLAVDFGPDTVVDSEVYGKYLYSGCYSQKGNIKDILPIYSPAALWGYAKRHYGLQEGTLMALASSSTSELNHYEWQNIYIKKNEDIKDVIDEMNKLFHYVQSFTIDSAGKLFNHFDLRFTEAENKISMVMKEINKKSLIIMDKNINNIIKKYNIDPSTTYLALSGGYALNCPTNSYLMNKYKFKGFIAPPCVNDSGMALGIALYTFYKGMNQEKLQFNLETAFYGELDGDLENVVKKYKEFVEDVSEMNLDQVIEDLEGYPIAWFNGAAEIGPRALGNRSLLADPRKEEMKDILNTIKQREWWRPVAPIVLEDKMNEWFENVYSSSFMLHTFKVKEDKKTLVPAIRHLDDTARVQSLTEDSNEDIYKIIDKFYCKTGIPMICNTSLNDRGEPIINTIEELFNFVLRKKIPVAYINCKRILFKNHYNFEIKEFGKRKIDFINYIDRHKKEELLNQLNPYHCSKEALQLYATDVRMQSEIDITQEKGAIMLNKLYKMRKNLSKRQNGLTF